MEHKDFVQLNDGDAIFYSKFEVTNKQYKLFLEDIKNKNRSKYSECMVKSEYWTKNEKFSYNKPFERNYFSHKAYNEHPVVNISYEAAQEYCKWLNTQLGDEKDNYYFRLPTEKEFNDLVNTVSIKYDSDDVGDYKKSGLHFNLKFEGNYPQDGGFYTVIANNAIVKMTIDSKAEGTKKQYVQNKYGIQHIIGNVHEFIDGGNYIGGGWDSFPSEVTKIEAYKEPNPTVGFRIVKVAKS